MGTKLGKALVYLNLILALGLSTMAVGIFTNRVNWAGKASADEQEGLQSKLRGEIQHYQELYGMARLRWEEGGAALAGIEAIRPVEVKWQAEQLHMLETGKDQKDNPAQNPVKQFTYDANGRLKVDASGRPMMVPHPNPNLKPHETLAQEIRAEDDKIGELIKQINMLITQEEEKTFFLDGKPGEEGKGLYGLLDELETAHKQSLKEAEFIKGFSVIRNIEADALQRRRQELQARIQELNRKLGIAAAREP